MQETARDKRQGFASCREGYNAFAQPIRVKRTVQFSETHASRVCRDPGSEVPIHRLLYSLVLYVVMHGTYTTAKFDAGFVALYNTVHSSTWWYMVVEGQPFKVDGVVGHHAWASILGE